MEDGIEQYRSTLFDNKIVDNRKIKLQKNYMYVCIPIEKADWEDYIITLDIEKALNILKLKKHKVEIFKKNSLDYYVPCYDCLVYNNSIINTNNLDY